MSTFPNNSSFHQEVARMAQRGRQTAADVARIGRALRRDTIPVEKQDLESWYRFLNALDNQDLNDLRDEIYAYLR
jgi:hypothetical protein